MLNEEQQIKNRLTKFGLGSVENFGCALNKQSVDKQSVNYTPCKKAVVKNTPCKKAVYD